MVPRLRTQHEFNIHFADVLPKEVQQPARFQASASSTPENKLSRLNATPPIVSATPKSANG